MLTVHTVGDQSVIGVYIVKDRIGIGLMASCEDYHLEVLSGFLKTLDYVGPDVDACADYVLGVRAVLVGGEVYLKQYLGILLLYIVHAMDQGLIHIEDSHLSLLIWPLRGR